MKRNRLMILVAWIAQAVSHAAVAVAFAWIPLAFVDRTDIARAIGAAYRWGLYPAASAASAYLATRFGLSNYLSWIAPPVAYAAVPWAMIGFPPDAGAMFLVSFLSILGAAAGDVRNRFGRDGAK